MKGIVTVPSKPVKKKRDRTQPVNWHAPEDVRKGAKDDEPDKWTDYTYTTKVEAELAEARAQIAAKGNVPPVLDELIASLEDQLTKTEDKLREARAQIAAKDAALQAVAGWLGSDRAAYPNALACIQAALAAPARETAP